MKLDIVEQQYIQDTTTDKPIFSGMEVRFESRSQDRSVVRGSFIVQGERFSAFVKDREKGKTVRDLCEELIREHLEVDKVDVDSFDVTSVKRKVENLEKQNLELAIMLSNGGAV